MRLAKLNDGATLPISPSGHSALTRPVDIGHIPLPSNPSAMGRCRRRAFHNMPVHHQTFPLERERSEPNRGHSPTRSPNRGTDRAARSRPRRFVFAQFSLAAALRSRQFVGRLLSRRLPLLERFTERPTNSSRFLLNNSESDDGLGVGVGKANVG